MQEKIESDVVKHRKKAGVTQKELAKNVGVTRQTIIAIEKGNYTPSVALAIKIAEFFGTTVEKLFKINT